MSKRLLPYTVWTFEEKSRFIQARIKLDHLFEIKTRNLRDSWLKVIKIARVPYLIRTCRKQWQNILKRYKELCSTVLKNPNHTAADFQELSKKWEFFNVIHAYATKKRNSSEQINEQEDEILIPEEILCEADLDTTNICTPANVAAPSTSQGQVSLEQKTVMVDFFEKNPELRSTKAEIVGSLIATGEYVQLWSALAGKLNNMGHFKKCDWKLWRKTWRNFETQIRRKLVLNDQLYGLDLRISRIMYDNENRCSTDTQSPAIINPLDIIIKEELPDEEKMDAEDSFANYLEANGSIDYNAFEDVDDNNDIRVPRISINSGNSSKYVSNCEKFQLKKDYYDKKIELKQNFYQQKIALMERMTISLEHIAQSIAAKTG